MLAVAFCFLNNISRIRIQASVPLNNYSVLKVCWEDKKCSAMVRIQVTSVMFPCDAAIVWGLWIADRTRNETLRIFHNLSEGSYAPTRAFNQGKTNVGAFSVIVKSSRMFVAS